MDDFKTIYRILSYLHTAMDYDEVDLERLSPESLRISPQRRNSILEMLVREGYIDGVTVKRSADGYLEISIAAPRITLKGLEYLEENSMMKKVASAVKGVVEIIT